MAIQNEHHNYLVAFIRVQSAQIVQGTKLRAINFNYPASRVVSLLLGKVMLIGSTSQLLLYQKTMKLLRENHRQLEEVFLTAARRALPISTYLCVKISLVRKLICDCFSLSVAFFLYPMRMETALSLFSTRRICSREQRKKQLDWLATNTDDITSQSHSLFACSREKNRQVENGL